MTLIVSAALSADWTSLYDLDARLEMLDANLESQISIMQTGVDELTGVTLVIGVEMRHYRSITRATPHTYNFSASLHDLWDVKKRMLFRS